MYLRLEIHIPDSLSIVEALQQACVIAAGAELLIMHECDVEWYRGLDTLDDKLFHSTVHLDDTLFTGLGAADDLGQQ